MALGSRMSVAAPADSRFAPQSIVVPSLMPTGVDGGVGSVCPPGYMYNGAIDTYGTDFFYTCLLEGGGGVDVEPVGNEPWCSAGWGRWANPRYVEKSTGTPKVDETETAVDPQILRDFFRQAWFRSRAAFIASGMNPDGFIWHGAASELTALTLQIEKSSDPNASSSGGWIYHGRPMAERGKTWSVTTINGKTVSRAQDRLIYTQLGSKKIDTALPETILAPSNEAGTQIGMTSWVEITPVDDFPVNPDGTTGDGIIDEQDTRAIASVDDVIRMMESRIASLSRNNGAEPLSLDEFAAAHLLPYRGWTPRESDGDWDPLLPAGALRNAFTAAAQDGRVISGGHFLLYKFSGGDPRTIVPFTDAAIAALKPTDRIMVTALTPNRSSVATTTDSERLFQALLSIVKRNLLKERLDLGVPDLSPDIVEGRVSKKVLRNHYIFPAFHAPSEVDRPGLCQSGRTTPWGAYSVFTSPQNIDVKPLRAWDTSDQATYNGCLTRFVYDLASYNRRIDATNMRGNACWLNWREREIPEPMFKWSDAINGYMPQVSYHPFAEGTVGQPVRLFAHRDKANYVSYPEKVGGNTFEVPIPWTSDLSSEVVCTGSAKCGVELKPTLFNLTQIGVSAEVGVPGDPSAGYGGRVLQRITRTDAAASSYDFDLIFAQTPLEALQTPGCRKWATEKELLDWCGIGYSKEKQEWFFRVHVRPWYGGVYYSALADLTTPKLRGLFNDEHTTGLPKVLTDLSPDRIRDYTYPGPYQSWAMRFDRAGGVTADGPRFELDGGDWTVMRSLAAEIPAYTLMRGSYYPIADASGLNSCESPYVDRDPAGQLYSTPSRCFVDVFVRSRQPLLDR